MKKNSNNFFTPSELSRLTGVSRQLLIYYDNSDIFKPDVIAENGYRYYSFYQYAILEIIVALRKMDVSLQDIKTYLNERNSACLKDIYIRRLKKCEADMKKLQNFKLQLIHNLEPLNYLENLRLNQVMLAEMYDITPHSAQTITMDIAAKERMKKIAKFLLPTLTSDSINDYYIGYILKKDILFTSEAYNQYKVFLHDILPDSSRPLRLYLYLYAKFDHNIIPQETKAKVSDFIKTNDLEILSDIYILPINNHLITKGENQRINKIYMQVEYKNQ